MIKMIRKLWKSIGVAALGLAAVGFVAYGAWNSHTTYVAQHLSAMEQQMLVSVSLIRHNLEEFILEHQGDLKILANTPEVKEQAYNKIRWDEESAEFCIFNNFHESHKDSMDALYLLDNTGIILDRDPMVKGKIGMSLRGNPGVDYVLENHEAHVSKMFYNKQGKPAISISEPIFYDGEFVGMVRWMTKIATISEHYLQPVKIGQQGYAVLLDDDGTVYHHPESELVGKNIAEIRKQRLEGDEEYEIEVIDDILSGSDGSAHFEWDELSKELSCFAWTYVSTTTKVSGAAGIKLSYDDQSSRYMLEKKAKLIALELDRKIPKSGHLIDAGYLQNVLEEFLAKYPDVIELNIHGPRSAEDSTLVYKASTNPDLVGIVSDPEDVQAAKDDHYNTLFVEQQPGRPYADMDVVDVTVPIHTSEELWPIIVTRPHTEIMAPINKHARNTYGLLGLLFLLFLLYGAGMATIYRMQKRKAVLEAETENLKIIAETSEALAGERNLLRTLIDNLPDSIYVKDTKGRFILGNIEVARRLGAKTPEELIGKTDFDLHPQELAAQYYADEQEVIRSGQPLINREEQVIDQTTGKRIWNLTTKVPLRDGYGTITRIVGIGRNITERKRAKERLSSEKERLSVTLRSIGDGVIATDTDGIITLVNTVVVKLTGWTEEEAIGKPLGEVFHIINEDTRERCENPAEEVLATGGIVGLANRTVLIARDGTERIIADSGAPIHDINGETIGVVVVFQDITEKRRMEAELLRMDKLESIGTLAGGIAHDFNNILTAIIGNISLAEMYVESGRKTGKVLERLKEAERASMQAEALTQQLLTFSKGGAPIKKMASISELLKESVVLALRGSNVRSEFSIPDDLWPVEIDEGQINQVINNLIINADQAMASGGIVKARAENMTVKAEHGFPVKDGGYVKISIEDHGIGIPEDDLPKIFDPYFTTKQKGSGLGLSTSYSIIKNHDGHIIVESQVGVGTTFHIYLPASTEGTLVVEEKVAKQPITGEGNILVMDDEKHVRDTAAEMLSSLGYKVTTAIDGVEAIEIYKEAMESGNPFDAIIMDLTIPGGMGGKETIEKLIEIDPEVKAIVSSGYSSDPVMADFGRYGFKGVIAKPYKTIEMSEVLHRVITYTNDR